MSRSNEGGEYSDVGFFKNLEILEQKRKIYFSESRNNYELDDSEYSEVLKPTFDVQMTERNLDVDTVEKHRKYFFESQSDRIVDVENREFEIIESEPRKFQSRSNSKNYDDFYGNFQAR